MKKWILLVSTLFALPLAAQDVKVQWGLQGDSATVGRVLLLSLQVAGTDQVTLPNLEEDGLTILLTGSQPTRSSSTITVNGRTTSETRVGYQAVWSLKASRSGRFSLRGYRIGLAGRQETLPEVTWEVREPQTSSSFLLKQTLEPPELVPGLEAVYTLKWYLGETAQDPTFSLPLVDSGAFEWMDGTGSPGGDMVVLEYGNRTLEGEKTAEIVGGKQFTVITFRLNLRALRVGTWDLSSTVLNFQGATSYREYYDFFGDKKRQPVFQDLSIPANPLKVTVQDFPKQGRPEPFSGLVGDIKITWTSAPGTYRVGESIPLTLNLGGVLNMKDLDVDYMVQEAYRQSPFRFSDGRPGTQGGREYTLRVASAGRFTLPGLRLNYFNPQTGTYHWAEAPGIDLMVEGGQVGPTTGNSSSETLGFRAPHVQGGEGTWPWHLVVILPLGSMGYMVYSWWKISTFRRKRFLRRQFIRLLRSFGAEKFPEEPTKHTLAQGLSLLAQMETFFVQGEELFPLQAIRREATTLWASEKALWENAYYSAGDPPWSPRERMNAWCSKIMRMLK